MLRRREVLLVKEESTYRTDSVPTGSNAVFVSNLQYSSNARQNERPGVKLTKNPYKTVFGGRTVQLTFMVEMKGSGSAGTAPEMDVLLQICGLLKTVNSGTSVVYTPLSSQNKSATIYYYQDGKLHKLLGCIGTLELNLAAGEFGKLNFTITGHPAADTDVALPSPTYVSTTPPIVASATLTVGGYAAICGNVKMMLNGKVAIPPDVNQANGWGQLRVTDWDIAGSIDPEDVLVATKNWYSLWEAGTNMAINIGAIGSTAGNRYTLAMPACSFSNIQEQERDGISTLEIGFKCVETSGDDEITLTFN